MNINPDILSLDIDTLTDAYLDGDLDLTDIIDGYVPMSTDLPVVNSWIN